MQAIENQGKPRFGLQDQCRCSDNSHGSFVTKRYSRAGGMSDVDVGIG